MLKFLFCGILDVSNETQMYICTLVEFILVEAFTLLYKYEVRMNWIYMEITQVFIQTPE